MSFVQGNTSGGSSSNTTSKSVTLSSPVTAGNVIVGSFTYEDTVTTRLSDIVDDQGNSYKANVFSIVDSGEPQFLCMFWGAPTNGPTTFTGSTTTGKPFMSISVDELTGVDPSAITGHGLQVQASPGTSNNAVKSGSTFGASGGIRWGFTSLDDTGGITVSTGTGYTQGQNTTPSTGTNPSIVTEWMVSMGVADVTFTLATNTRTITGGMSFGAAVTAITMAAAAGSFAMTGIAALFRRFLLSVAAGAFSLAGQAAAFERGLRLAASAGAFTETGIAATFARGFKLVAAAASFTLAGVAAILKRGLRFAVSAGAITLTGIAATLSHAVIVTLAVAAAAFALTGNAVTFGIGRKWAKAADATGTWTKANLAAASWTKAVAATGTWTKQSVSAAAWTVKTVASAAWEKIS